MRSSFVIGSALLIAPLLLFFVPFLPKCDYGFINASMNLLPSGNEWIVFVVASCLFGYIILIWSIFKNNKETVLHFKLYKALLLTVSALILIVIAIASLNTSRSKSPNAAMKAYISQSRAYAEIFREDSIQNGYLGFCESEGYHSTEENIIQRHRSQRIPDYCIQPTDLLQCNDSKEAYAISGKVIEKGKTSYFCVDSAGFSGIIDEPVLGVACK